MDPAALSAAAAGALPPSLASAAAPPPSAFAVDPSLAPPVAPLAQPAAPAAWDIPTVPAVQEHSLGAAQPPSAPDVAQGAAHTNGERALAQEDDDDMAMSEASGSGSGSASGSRVEVQQAEQDDEEDDAPYHGGPAHDDDDDDVSMAASDSSDGVVAPGHASRAAKGKGKETARGGGGGRGRRLDLPDQFDPSLYGLRRSVRPPFVLVSGLSRFESSRSPNSSRSQGRAATTKTQVRPPSTAPPRRRQVRELTRTLLTAAEALRGGRRRRRLGRLGRRAVAQARQAQEPCQCVPPSALALDLTWKHPSSPH